MNTYTRAETGRTELASFAARTTSVAGGRTFVRQVCSSWRLEEEHIYTAALVATELIANAVTASSVVSEPAADGVAALICRHMSQARHRVRGCWMAWRARASDVASARELQPGVIAVRLVELQGSVVIGVWDKSPRPPVFRIPSEEAESGRGLQLVDALSIRWGHYDIRAGGKVVWCQLGTDGTEDTDAPDNPIAYRQVVAALQAHMWNDEA